MERKELLKNLVDNGRHARQFVTCTAVLSDLGPRPVGEFWDSNKTLDVIVNGAHAVHDTVRETDELIHHVDDIKTGRIGWDDNNPITNIKALTNSQIDSLKTGDTVIKTTGDEKHSYTVAYKKDDEMSLVYTDSWTVEEVYYEKQNGNWTYIQTDTFKPEDYYTKTEINSKFDDMLGMDANDITTLKNAIEDLNDGTGLLPTFNTKQDTLISGTNIKTISEQSILGSGNIDMYEQLGLSNYILKSLTDGLVKNDGTIDTNTYLTQHQDISSKADTTYVDNNFVKSRTTRLTDFSLDDLKAAVADGNLEKYGLKVGDQKTINGHTYVIADLNPMKGTSTPYRLTDNHVGLIVIPHTTQAWNVSGHTYEGADNRGAGYLNSDLHYYLKNTLLPLVNTDLGSTNILGHSKLLSNAVNQNGYNRFGEATGCSSGWTWEADCKICALSEVQVYGSIVWSSSGFDTGEACRQLEVFKKYSHTEIFGNEYPWLRDVVSASHAARADNHGYARNLAASDAYSVVALILFH